MFQKHATNILHVSGNHHNSPQTPQMSLGVPPRPPQSRASVSQNTDGVGTSKQNSRIADFPRSYPPMAFSTTTSPSKTSDEENGTNATEPLFHGMNAQTAAKFVVHLLLSAGFDSPSLQTTDEVDHVCTDETCLDTHNQIPPCGHEECAEPQSTDQYPHSTDQYPQSTDQYPQSTDQYQQSPEDHVQSSPESQCSHPTDCESIVTLNLVSPETSRRSSVSSIAQGEDDLELMESNYIILAADEVSQQDDFSLFILHRSNMLRDLIELFSKTEHPRKRQAALWLAVKICQNRKVAAIVRNEKLTLAMLMVNLEFGSLAVLCEIFHFVDKSDEYLQQLNFPERIVLLIGESSKAANKGIVCLAACTIKVLARTSFHQDDELLQSFLDADLLNAISFRVNAYGTPQKTKNHLIEALATVATYHPSLINACPLELLDYCFESKTPAARKINSLVDTTNLRRPREQKQDRKREYKYSASHSCAHTRTIKGVVDVDAEPMNSVPKKCARPDCQNGEDPSCAVKQCTGCMAVFYCSRSCQKLHWPQHKKLCQMIAK